MAFKQQAVAAVHQDSVDVTIDGLTPIPGEEGRFRLTGVVRHEVHWGKVADLLKEAGIDSHDANVYADDMAELVFIGEMSKAIAKRMKL